MSQLKFLLVLLLLISHWPVQAEEGVPLHHQSADVCKLCHKEIYKAWRTSKHARSVPLKNPLLTAFYTELGLDGRKEGQTLGADAYPGCLNCHAPNAALDGKTKVDAMPAYAEGVNCVACHQLASHRGGRDASGKPKLGIRAYEVSEQIQGPLGFSVVATAEEDDKGNPHLGQPILFHGKAIPSLPLKANARQLKTADACLGCHQGRDNDHGISLCSTGEEVIASQPRVECQSCHMVPLDGVVDHGMGVGQERARLKQALLFELDLKPRGAIQVARLVLSSKLPHGLPTGTPFKSLVIRFKAYDAQGKLLWESKGDDPAMVLSLELVDEAGQPTTPKLATKVARDTRLRPFGSKALEVEIPRSGVALVRAELYWQPLWPRLAKAMPDLPQEIIAESLVTWVETAVTVAGP